MTFKQCVTWFLCAPLACWGHYGGWAPFVRAMLQLLKCLHILFDLCMGLALCIGAPVFGPLLWLYRLATAKRRAGAQLARDRARFEDV